MARLQNMDFIFSSIVVDASQLQYVVFFFLIITGPKAETSQILQECEDSIQQNGIWWQWQPCII